MSKLLALLTLVSFVGLNSIVAKDTKKADDHKDHADKKEMHTDHKDAKHAAKNKKEEKKADATPTKFNELDKDAVNAKLGKAVIVDARKVDKDGDIIKGAIVIPAEADDKKIAEVLKDKDAEIIVYCGNAKCPASSTLGFRLVELGYKNVGHYAGGIAEWTESELPTDKYEG